MTSTETATKCVTIGFCSHGIWRYLTVDIYYAGTKKDGSACWLKDRTVWEATTAKKIQRLAEQVSREQGIPLIPHVRHYSPLTKVG